jgi:hypothetical protein
MRVLRWFPGLAVSATLVVTGVPTAATAATEIDLHAALHHSAAYTTATAYSEDEQEGTAREVGVTLRHVLGLAGQRVSVFVNYKKVGTMVVSRFGNAHRAWETTDGQYVPMAAAGAPERVRTAGGTLIAAGRYYRAYP